MELLLKPYTTDIRQAVYAVQKKAEGAIRLLTGDESLQVKITSPLYFDGQVMNLRRLQLIIEDHFDIDNLAKRSRRTDYIAARRIFNYVAVNELLYNKSDVGRFLKLDHTTALNSYKTCNDLLMAKDKLTTDNYNCVLKKINQIRNAK